MEDYGARWTDERIAELEERIISLFAEAHEEVYEKYMAFCRKFERDDKKYSQQLQEGKITAATYRDWLRGQVFQRKRWQAQLEDLAKTLTRANQAAMDIVNGETPGVFAMNANWAEFEIEQAGNINMGFGLYDENTVKALLRDEPELLPPSRVNIPEDERWNMKAITRQINMGIVMGEGLEGIAKRLRKVADMSANQARTHARTAMTGAQNAGRIEGYHQAEAMGIELHKEWLATLDNRTRHAHAALDGQHVPVDEPFQSERGEIMYPGDPNARPANVYNCRCTLISRDMKYPPRDAMRRPNMQELGDALVQKPIKDMTYAEWARWKDGLAKTKSSSIIKKMPDGDVDVLQSVGNIDIEKYHRISQKIRSSRIVLTEKAKNHIIERRGQEFFDKYSPYFKDIAENPDYIFEDKAHENSAIASKTIVEKGKNINLVIKLAVEGDKEGYENSIITAIIENDKRYQQRLRNNIPVYKKE